MTTEWAPRDEVLAWTGDIIAAHPRHRAILLTHAYLGDEDNGRYDWDARGSRQHWSPRGTRVSATVVHQVRMVRCAGPAISRTPWGDKGHRCRPLSRVARNRRGNTPAARS